MVHLLPLLVGSLFSQSMMNVSRASVKNLMVEQKYGQIVGKSTLHIIISYIFMTLILNIPPPIEPCVPRSSNGGGISKKGNF